MTNENSNQLIIGYLIPEFPGQTHIFFWRERKELLKLGVLAELVSTRKSKKNIYTHAWEQEAIKETFYLYPPKFLRIIKTLGVFITARWEAWRKLYHLFYNSEASLLKEKVRLFGLIFMGGVLATIAIERKWSHIHVHSCGNSANIAMFASAISNITYSLTLHNPLFVHGKNQRLKWANADFAIVVSKKILQSVEQELSGYLPKIVAFAPMGVDTENFERLSPYKLDSNQKIIIFSCGRINFSKGHDLLIRAIGVLIHKGLNLHLRIAGAMDSEENTIKRNLEDLIKNLALNNNVTLLGALSEEKIKKELEGSQIFVLASRGTSGEGIPVVLMEAMAMELPVVATDVGGVSELVDNDKNGLLIQPDDENLIVTAIDRLILNPDFARTLGKNGRSKIISDFNSSISAKKLLDCLKNV